MAWDDTAKNCINLYGGLVTLNQIDVLTSMDDAAKLTMKDLQFYNNTASSAVNNASALALARSLDQFLYNTCASTYGNGYTTQKAISAINNILADSTKTVTNLADAIAPIYSFP